MKKHQFIALIIQLFPVLLLPLDWYKNIIVNSENFSLENANGLFVFMEDRGRFGIIYLLNFFILFLFIKNKKYIFTLIISNILCMLILISFPVPVNAMNIYTVPMLLQKYDKGFYLCIITLLINICVNIKFTFKNN